MIVYIQVPGLGALPAATCPSPELTVLIIPYVGFASTYTFTLVVASLSVLVDVETFLLDALVYAETLDELDAVEEYESGSCSP